MLKDRQREKLLGVSFTTSFEIQSVTFQTFFDSEQLISMIFKNFTILEFLEFKNSLVRDN